MRTADCTSSHFRLTKPEHLSQPTGSSFCPILQRKCVTQQLRRSCHPSNVAVYAPLLNTIDAQAPRHLRRAASRSTVPSHRRASGIWNPLQSGYQCWIRWLNAVRRRPATGCSNTISPSAGNSSRPRSPDQASFVPPALVKERWGT